MAAVSILQIVEAIETRLATISGLRVSEYVPDQVNPPQAFVGPPPVTDYRTTFRRGIFTVQPTVTILTSAATDRGGQRRLMEFMAPTGSSSIPTALETDPTLGGVVDSCMVASFASFGLEQVGAIGYFGGVFQLQVIAQGV